MNMSDRLFLSIITINFNNSSGLKKTLESVKNQTSKNYEHIIIDGASTDGSVDLIKEFLMDSEYAKQVSFWCSEKDKGIYDAMNKGIPHANGRYCLFLNSGDYLADNEVIARFDDYNLTEDIVYTNCKCFNSHKEWLITYPSHVTLGYFYKMRSLNHQNVFIKTEKQKAHFYSLDFKICSDKEFFMYCFQDITTTQHFIKNDIIAKYENETGISTTNIETLLQETKRLNDLYFSPAIQASFSYLYENYNDVKKQLDLYENCYHGVLRRLKNMFLAYSHIKARFHTFLRKKNDT